MYNKFQKFVDISKALFISNSELRCQHFSFITYKNRILAIGLNNKKTSPKNLKNKRIARNGEDISPWKGTCSELAAIIKLKNTTNINFNRCILINVRIDRNKEINNSYPCSSCKNLLKYFGFKQVFYTDKNGFKRYYD